MLTQDEQKTVQEIFSEFARRGQVRAAETAELLSRLPGKPEAIELFIGLGRTRGMPWIEYLGRTLKSIQTGEQDPPSTVTATLTVQLAWLSQLLASSEPYSRKVEALLAALRGQLPHLESVVREQFPREKDPFVLATLASVLGHCGDTSDGHFLIPLLENEDQRVVANALEAIYRLDVPVDNGLLQGFLESEDNRIRTNALAILLTTDHAQALDMIRELSRSDNPSARTGVAYLLGELTDSPSSRELLLGMLDPETNTAVLKQIAVSLKKHAGAVDARMLIGPLYGQREVTSGAKRSVMDMLLFEIAGEAGMAEAQVRELGEAYLATAATGGPVTRPETAVPAIPAPLAAPEVPATPPAPESEVAGGAGELEEEEPLSFSGVWGIPVKTGSFRRDEVPPGEAAEKPAPTSRPPRALSWRLTPVMAGGALAAVLGFVGLVWLGSSGADSVTHPVTRPARRETIRPELAPGTVKLTGAPASPAATATEPEAKDLEAVLGPMGAPVDLTGTVVGVSFGRVIVTAAGHHYMVVRGKMSEEARTGDTLHITGKLLGSSQQGLFYVEAR